MKKFWKIFVALCIIACLCSSCGNSGQDRKAGTGSLIKWRESEALKNADNYAPDGSIIKEQPIDTTTAK